MLAIAVEFLTGRYVATAYNDRTRSEWPPHPARLFSALVAAHFEEPTAQGRMALEWLEQQGPPEIVGARLSGARDLHTVFVPVNDKASEPETRVRQPRTFPSVTPETPSVQFVWPSVETTPVVHRALDELTSRVVRLGHSSSLVSVHLPSRVREPSWRPDEQGSVRLRVVGPGQLQALEDRFVLHRESEPRVMPALFTLYSDTAPRVAKQPLESVFSDDWLVFRRARKHERRGPAVTVPCTGAVGLARVVRNALMRFAPQPPPELLSGHSANGQPSSAPHLSIVPLPSIGGSHSDGSILGIALIAPRASSGRERQALYAAVGAWEASARTGDADDRPTLPVHLGRAGAFEVRRADPIVDDISLEGLRPQGWCRPSHRWLTATPIALDRNPGDLWSRDADRRSEALTQARDILSVACERIGVPRPAAVEILPAAPLKGAAKARHYPPYPGRDDRHQRVLVHAELVFAEAVQGPILLGAGRYLGLGVLRPVDYE